MSTSFYKSIKKVEVSDDGRVKALKGSCKAKDFQKKVLVENYFDSDTFKELNVKRMASK